MLSTAGATSSVASRSRADEPSVELGSKLGGELEPEVELELGGEPDVGQSGRRAGAEQQGERQARH